MIDCQAISKRLGGRPVLAKLDLQVRGGETLVLCGRSGVGKTTLLRAINGLEPLDSGRITVDGLPVWPHRDGARHLKGKVGMLFQHFNLFEHLSALDNICLAPRQVLRLSKAEAEARAHALLAELGLADKALHYPAYLSGGEKQRVALARCLAMRPSVMLLDEPTSALDPARARQVGELIRRVSAERVAVLIVTHDQAFAYQVADRMMSLESDQLIDLQHDRSCCRPEAELAPPARATVPESESVSLA
jgi:ABC-type polar amino acid transport system ATPase subunit